MPDKQEGDKSKRREVSRLEKLKKSYGENYLADMPPLECGEHLLEHFWSVGPSTSGGMGEAPISHVELAAYQENTGIELSSWEVLTLRRLSSAYISESHKATKRDCLAPWKSDVQQAAIRVAVGRDLEAEMDGITEQ